MWDDPPFQVRLVGFLGGIAAPCIVVGEVALNKMIAYFSNRHYEKTSLQWIWANFSKQSRTALRAESASEYWKTVPITLLR